MIDGPSYIYPRNFLLGGSGDAPFLGRRTLSAADGP